MTARRFHPVRLPGARALPAWLGAAAAAALVWPVPPAMPLRGADRAVAAATSAAVLAPAMPCTPGTAGLHDTPGPIAIARAAPPASPPVVPCAWHRTPAVAAALAQAAPRAVTDPSVLLERVKANLRRERELLLEYTYREKRRAIKVSPLGKVSVGDEELYEVYPSSDPDVPRRVLVAVNGRPLTPAERAAWLASRGSGGPDDEGPRDRQQRLRREAEARRKAEQRFEDAFRVFRFELDGQETVDGRLARVVLVRPQRDARTVSDAGRWMKKFEGRAWVSEADAELLRLELVAVDTIWIGLGIVGRVHEGTRITYTRRPDPTGVWFPARARIEARGRTLLFRSFNVDSVTEWFDYRRHEPGRPTGDEVPRPTDLARDQLRL